MSFVVLSLPLLSLLLLALLWLSTVCHGTPHGVIAVACRGKRLLALRQLGKGDHYPGQRKNITPSARSAKLSGFVATEPSEGLQNPHHRFESGRRLREHIHSYQHSPIPPFHQGGIFAVRN